MTPSASPDHRKASRTRATLGVPREGLASLPSDAEDPPSVARARKRGSVRVGTAARPLHLRGVRGGLSPAPTPTVRRVAATPS